MLWLESRRWVIIHSLQIKQHDKLKIAESAKFIQQAVSIFLVTTANQREESDLFGGQRRWLSLSFLHVKSWDQENCPNKIQMSLFADDALVNC